MLKQHQWVRNYTLSAETAKDVITSRLFTRLRALSGGVSLPVSTTGPLATLRALKKGDVVAIRGDFDREGDGRLYRIGGADYRLPLSAVALAVQGGLPIRPCFLLRRGWSRFTLVVLPDMIPHAELPPTERSAEIMQRIARELERLLQASPANWQVW